MLLLGLEELKKLCPEFIQIKLTESLTQNQPLKTPKDVLNTAQLAR